MSAANNLAAALRRVKSVLVLPPPDGSDLARAGIQFVATVSQWFPELDIEIVAQGTGSNPLTALIDAVENRDAKRREHVAAQERRG